MSSDSSNDDIDNFIWVQCENPKCTKWRKLQKDFCEDFEKVSWFCHMNPDPNYNKCNLAQEKMKKKRGETIVFSELQCGELVWAKMAGYPRWPGIITPDPIANDGAHIDYYADGEGDPNYYHIEFLGQPSSHAWILASQVEKYNMASVDLMFKEKSMKRKKLQQQLQNAQVQATQLFSLTPEQRLKHCVYKYQPLVSEKPAENEIKSETIKNIGRPPKVKETTKETVFINVNGKVYPLEVSVPKELQTSETTNVTVESMNHAKKESKHQCKSSIEPNTSNSPKYLKENNCNQPIIGTTTKHQGPKMEKIKLNFEKKKKSKENTTLKDKRLRVNQGESKITQNNNTLADDSIKTPFNDEETFWCSYRGFCEERKMNHGVKYVSWYNRKIDLFHLYQKVHHVGGYKQATSHWKIWRNICWCLTNTSVDSQFLSLRKAYRQVLLPYERHQRGEEKKKRKASVKLPTMVCSKDLASHCHTVTTSPLTWPKTSIVPATDVRTSPVYPLITNSLVNKSPINKTGLQVVPNLPGASGLPLDTSIAQPDVLLASSNPNSPTPEFSPSLFDKSPAQRLLNVFTPSPGGTVISDIGLSAALGEIDDLESQLNDLKDSQLSNVVSPVLPLPSLKYLKEEERFKDSGFDSMKNTYEQNSYEPITGSQNEELNDVLGEINNLEDTLLEMAGDIMCGGSSP